MTLVVSALASSSQGNATLLRLEQTAILIDCGLSMRAIERHLRLAGLEPADLHAILLTHEHGDHALSAGKLARRYGLPVVCNAATRVALGEQLAGAAVELLPIGEAAAIGPFDITSFRLPHDAAAPVGYSIAAAGVTVGLAVDLGSWTEEIVGHLRPADLLIVEANHDREQLQVAPYPQATRQRIFSSLGHLDNVQTGELLARIGADGRERDVWLAHLSEQANTPERARKGVGRVLRMAGISGLRLVTLPRLATLAPPGTAVWSSDGMLKQKSLFG
jgi:phosphoribosyl 1,2-cyclic phosphodiesterase